MVSNGNIVETKNLKKYFPLDKHRVVKAVDDVSISIRKGDVLGLVGESGCGKTTLGRVMLKLIEPTEGKMYFEGVDIYSLSKKELRKMRQKMQIVFQDPYSSLNPRMPISTILTFPMKVQGLFKGKEKERAAYLLDVVGMKKSDLNRYPHEFSGGQLQRVGLARSLAVDPIFVVADEPVSALDVSIQSQVLNLFKDLQQEFQLTMLFIAHDLSAIEFISDHIAVLYMGKVVEKAPSTVLYNSGMHPYAKILLSAVPLPDPRIEKQKKLVLPKGEVPSPINPPPGCRFYPRCTMKMDICKEKDPELIEVKKDHFVSCFLFKKEKK